MRLEKFKILAFLPQIFFSCAQKCLGAAKCFNVGAHGTPSKKKSALSVSFRLPDRYCKKSQYANPKRGCGEGGRKEGWKEEEEEGSQKD